MNGMYRVFENESVEGFSKISGLDKELVENIFFIKSLGVVLKHDCWDNHPFRGSTEIEVDTNYEDMVKNILENLESDPRLSSHNPNYKGLKTTGDFLNFQLKKWTERNEQLEDDKDWESMSFNMNKNRVLDWLDEKWDEIDDEEISNKIFRDSYIRMEYPKYNCGYDTIMMMFRLRSNPSLMMTEDEKKIIDELPDVVKIYRGVNVEKGDTLDLDEDTYDMGISWTIDKERGEWFGNRFNHEGRECYLLEGEIKKSDIICYFNSRKEDEVIIYPFQLKKLNVINLKIKESEVK